MKIEVNVERALPYDFEGSIRKLLAHVRPEHLVGIEKIAVWESHHQGRYRDALGLYGHRTKEEHTRIDLFLDNIYGDRVSRFYFLIPFLPAYKLSKVLYHEIGHHHQQFTHGIKRRAAEAHADRYSERAQTRYLAKALRPWAFLLKPLLPLYRMAYWLTHQRQLQELKRAVQADDRDLRAWGRLGELYYKGRFFSKARQCWMKVLSERPDNVPANLGMGCLYWREREFPAAVESWRKVLKEDPGNNRARELMRRASDENELFGIRRPASA